MRGALPVPVTTEAPPICLALFDWSGLKVA
jgi:hypothetical protein